MTSVNISLPDQMKEYVEGRIHEGGYGTTSEYFQDLVREDQKRQAEAQLEALLLEGLATSATEWTKEDVGQIKKGVRERLIAKQKAS